MMNLAKKAHERSALSHIEMDAVEIQRHFVVLRYADDGYTRVLEEDGKIVGCMVGQVGKNYWGVMAANDIVTYAEKGTHLLLKDFKRWAKEKGAQITYITDMSGDPRYRRLIELIGFQPVSQTFMVT